MHVGMPAFICVCIYSLSQCLPDAFGMHLHSKLPLYRSLQVPPFMHGLLRHIRSALRKQIQLSKYLDMSCRSQYKVVSNSAQITFTWLFSKSGLHVYVLL